MTIFFIFVLLYDTLVGVSQSLSSFLLPFSFIRARFILNSQTNFIHHFTHTLYHFVYCIHKILRCVSVVTLSTFCLSLTLYLSLSLSPSLTVSRYLSLSLSLLLSLSFSVSLLLSAICNLLRFCCHRKRHRRIYFISYPLHSFFMIL